MTISVNNDWQPILEKAAQKKSYFALREFLKKEYETTTVYPKKEDIWQAFEWTPYHEVKVVLLGQDPYHGKNQAHGLSFSVDPSVSIPPSLRNMYKELENDLGVPTPSHGYLKKWAKEGVLLLNTVLTVRKGQAHSHRKMGWENLTDDVIKALNDRKKPIVFLLWGNAAKSKRHMINEDRHKVITSAHPSPLSAYRGFFGSKPFSKTNKALKEMGEKPIDWEIPEVEN
ncbi:uracil-DNA glycosylase [Alkalibacterium kapii]|uniref:Uracil-DNA glycosylase n=1 Tax=Alkalibacterium kapii TaxID=426704 RepID=A0A511AUT5_9LACT|nr:uracil-DNA glycosylase [Alkalibacterium kapii]GEK91904.1 uracil-DNA glycosylase [Alkalibacterium kapii]